MAFFRWGALALALFSAVAPAIAQQASTEKHEPALDVRSMDRSVDPCTDFFAYSCGGWVKNNPIPPDQAAWDTYSKMQDENTARLRGILEAASKADPGRTAVTQKIGDYYASPQCARICLGRCFQNPPQSRRILILHFRVSIPRGLVGRNRIILDPSSAGVRRKSPVHGSTLRSIERTSSAGSCFSVLACCAIAGATAEKSASARAPQRKNAMERPLLAEECERESISNSQPRRGD